MCKFINNNIKYTLSRHTHKNQRLSEYTKNKYADLKKLFSKLLIYEIKCYKQD